MLDIICTKKEKTRVFLFFKLYKMMLNIFKSEQTCRIVVNPFGVELTAQIRLLCRSTMIGELSWSRDISVKNFRVDYVVRTSYSVYSRLLQCFRGG